MRRLFSDHSFGGRFLLYFGASLIQAVVAIVGIPLTTHFLDPRDFGAFALISSLVGVFSLIAEMGGTVVLSGHLRAASPDEAKVLLSTVVATSAVVAVACGGTLYRAWPELAPLLGISGLPQAAIALAAASIVPSAIWSSLFVYGLVSGRASFVSRLTVLLSLASFAGTMIGLYSFHLGGVALFLGAFVGPAVTALVGLGGLWGNFAPRISRRWLREIARTAPSAIAAGLSGGAQTVVERSTLSSYAGATVVGLYSHSQQYSAYFARVVKAVSNAVWPTALDEAADRNSKFERLGRAWMPVYAGLTCVGVLFAFFAPEIVTLLSHGKFTAAAPLVPIWVAYILLQNAAKPATATLYSVGRGASVSRAQMVSTMLGIGLLVILVPFFGQWGAAASLFASMFSFRVIMNTMASRVRSLPFQDGWVIGGCIVILAATAVETFLAPSLALKCLLCGATLAIIGILARDILMDLFGQVSRHVWPTLLWSRIAPR